MKLLPGDRLGPYEVLASLGEGGMGEVYKAHDPKLDRAVAVKVLPLAFAADAQALVRFEREAKALAALQHPNVLGIFDFGREGDRVYAVMELLQGRTLREALQDGPLQPRLAARVAGEIASGLAAAHAKAIAHRDLKPENVFLTSDGRTKILDFGLAKHLDLPRPDDATAQLDSGAARTERGALLGTVGYMAPEQVRGGQIDARTDVFAFGCVLYEMVTGARAFREATVVDTLHAILHKDPCPPDNLPSGSGSLLSVAHRCLEKDPEQRFQNAHDLAFALEALMGRPDEITLQPRPSGPAPEPAATGRRWLPWALAAGVLGLSLAGLWLVRKGGSATPAPYQRLSYRLGWITEARVMPDGGTVVFSAAFGDGQLRIYAQRIGQADFRPVSQEPAHLLGIAPSGELAVLQHPRPIQGLWGNRGTLATLNLEGGATRPLMEGVEGADWHPGGEGLALVVTQAGRSRIEFPRGTRRYDTGAWISALRFSPDGRQLAFLEHPLSGDDGGGARVLDRKAGGTPSATPPYFALSGPAGRGGEVWFTTGDALFALRPGGTPRQVQAFPDRLRLLDADRTGHLIFSRDEFRIRIRAKAEGATAERDLSWLAASIPTDLTPDGRQVLFFDGLTGRYPLFLRPMDGGQAVHLADGWPSALSHDGRMVAVVEQGEGAKLRLVPTGPGSIRDLITQGWAAIEALAWMPDGGHLLLLGRKGDDASRAYLMPVDGGAARPIGPPGLRPFPIQKCLSPDGAWAYLLDAEGHPALLNLEAGSLAPIKGLAAEEEILAWHAEGSGLLVHHHSWNPAESADVTLLDPRTGERRPWIELKPPAELSGPLLSNLVVGPGGRSFAYGMYSRESTLMRVKVP